MMHLLNRYIAYLKDRRSYEADTLSTNAYNVGKYLRKTRNTGRAEDARAYLATIENPRTRATVWSCAKAFERWRAAELGTADWTGQIHVKHYVNNSRDLFTADEIRAMLAACDDSPTGRRDYTVIMLLSQTAARRDEIRTLRRVDVDLPGATITARIKGGNREQFHLTPRAIAALDEWLPAVAGEHLFPGRHPDNPISRSGFREIVAGVAWRAGIRRRAHPHMLRHSAAQALLDADTPLEVIQQILHHKNLTTTVIYARCSPKKAFAAMDKILAGC